MANFITAEQAALLIPSGAHVAALGSGGGVLEPDLIYKALESRFLATGSPCGLTVTAACGFGDKREGGISRFAHEGMTARFIGGHWAWSPQMQRLALENRIEAYNLPQGVLVSNYREMAARRAGTLTRTGLHTFVDPRMGGGKVNAPGATNFRCGQFSALQQAVYCVGMQVEQFADFCGSNNNA